MLVKIVDCAIHPEEVIAQAKTNNSGCVVSYVGLIRDNSYEKAVQSVEYRDQDGLAESRLIKLPQRSPPGLRSTIWPWCTAPGSSK